MTDVTDVVAGAIKASVLQSQLLAGIKAASRLLEDITQINRDDDDLEPEILTAAKHLHDAAQALSRASTFVDVRLGALTDSLEAENGLD